VNASPIYTKSPKGLAELVSRQHNLDLKSRQILILIDGRNTVAHIQQMRPGLDVQAIVVRLLEEGFLEGEVDERDAPPGSATTPADIAIPEPIFVAPEKLDEARKIMLESSRQYIGILGADLLHKLSVAQDAAQIRNCISQWNMAMRDSRQGKTAVDQLLRKVNLAMGLELA
jgi:hypothetical protein